jgi:ribosomal protein S18 acetylase RimI-like enzyme
MQNTIEIKRIHKKDYNGKKLVPYIFESLFYYDVSLNETDKGWQFNLEKKKHQTPYVKDQVENVFDEYKDDAEVYAAYLDGREAGVLVISHIEWNQTCRIWDLYMYPEFKRKGIGSQLVQQAINAAQQVNTRMIVLETQTSNYPAIEFYKKVGFKLIGVDTASYSNNDIDKKDVRLEFGYKL